MSCQPFQAGANKIDYSVNRGAYDRADPSKTRVLVSLKDQRAWLLDGDGEVLVRTDVSTGVPGHDTPVGHFRVLERQEDKRSNKYGRYVDVETGKVVVPKNWLHKGPKPKGTKYQGIEMPYWMRLTWYGVGMHVGKFPKNTRCSFGCIRVYDKSQPLIYAKTQMGTPVEIVRESRKVEMGDSVSE